MWGWLLSLAALAVLNVDGAGAGAARLVCYTKSARITDFSECTHLVYKGDARGDKLDSLLKEFRKSSPKLKIVLRVAEADKDLRTLLKSKHLQGLEIYNAHKAFNKTNVLESVQAAKLAISSSGGGPLFLALPAHPELLAKYYDLRALVKIVDLMMVQTHALGLVKKMTYHPSRLSGLWDMMNTDSVVDLVVGLGVPASKVVISLPATARQFTLLNETLSTPGSPTAEDEPKEIDQPELCRQLQKGRWTLERDQDLSAPYAFKNKTWISFEDSSSVDVKGKYARVRGLAGLALHNADHDVETACGPTLKASLTKVLNQQSRAPRGAVLRSLEHEILSGAGGARALDALQVSPYRITQVVDSDGVIHSIREDTRTEFSCSRQGYFVHPRSCARFYRCVKFDQLSPDYTVFEFDCPAGLAFDSRYEVCVWPGSLPHSHACPGSSEIAPVPQTRFICPEHEGYYVDPENCRWFFACIDHGKAPLTAYEFRCPFGLGFDADKLKCEWPWLVPACGNIARYEAEAFGYSGAALTGAVGFQGQTADSINVAAHQSLVSGAALDNLVGIQGGFLTKGDASDGNFIASQELANGGSGHAYQIGHGVSSHDVSGLAYNVGQVGSNIGLVQATKFSDEGKYTSGALYLDDYRLPTAKTHVSHGSSLGVGQSLGQASYTSGQTVQHSAGVVGLGYTGQSLGGAAYTSGQTLQQSAGFGNAYSSSSLSSNLGSKLQYEGAHYEDNSGAYVHDPSGDYAEPYKHIDSPEVPYVHADSGYKHTGDYYDIGKYSGQNEGKYEGSDRGQYAYDNSGAYVQSNSGAYNDYSGSYNADYSGSYTEDNSGKYLSGVYRADGHIGSNQYNGASGKESSINSQHGSYSNANSGQYLSDSKAYTGASHTLTAGAVNVGLVGKTTLVDAGYTDQFNYQGSTQSAYDGASNAQSYSHGVVHTQPAQVSYVSQPAVSINHLGTDAHNLDGYSFVTTPTSSVIPTTATPIAVTTSLPVTYRTTYVSEAPKTTAKQIFGYTQPAVTYVQPTVVAVKQQYVTPKVQITDHNAGIAVTQGSLSSVSSGYDYPKPTTKFEDGVSFSTPAPIVVSTYRPQGFSHSQQTLHKVESVGFEYSTPTPVAEEPFKKLVAYTTGPSVTSFAQPSVSTYTPQTYSHQTVHKVEANKLYSPSVEVGYQQANIGVSYEQPKTVVEYTTAQPAIQPVVSTYQPQMYSQQTLHNVDASHVNTYSQNVDTGYEYANPAVKLIEEPTRVIVSTPAPGIISTYRPQTYSHQTIHKVEAQKIIPVSSTALPKVELTYQQPSVSIYENPILKYTPKITPLSYVKPTATVYTQTYQPILQQQVSHVVSQPIQYETSPQSYNTQNLELAQGYSYSQPEIQRDVETLNAAKSYSDASVVSHQVFHQSNVKSDYDSNKDIAFVSTTPSTLAYEDHYSEYQVPKKVETYKAPEYIPPKIEQQAYSVVSSAATPVFQQSSVIHHNQNNYDYKAVDQSQQYEAVQKSVPIQQVSFSTSHVETPKQVESVHLSSFPGTTITTKYQPVVYQAPEIQAAYKAEEYLPPVVSSVAPVVTSTYKPLTYSISTTREYLPPSPAPKYNAPEYLPPKVDTYLLPSTTARPILSTTQVPTYKYVESTTAYKAPEYLPPLEAEHKVVSFESFGLKNIAEISQPQIKYNPYQEYTVSKNIPVVPIQRKQNIVVETAKSNLLGFGTVGPDAGLVSPITYSTAAPIVVSSPETYSYSPKSLTSTYAPIRQELIEVTPSPIPVRKIKPKVAVVTKINDFNPLLVRKLGAVCSCQSPVLVLKGRRPNVETRDYDDYSDTNAGRGDIADYQWTQKLVQTPVATAAPIVTSTFNPIIVPDDSFYQDYQEPNILVTPKSKEIYSENFVSSTIAPAVFSATDKIVRIRPRIKAVTVAPTYKTVLLNEAVPAAAIVKASDSSIDSKSFDRYGPGGLRSRDETLQGSVDCQRAGLFRHPKQCNKFYACRWDCTKQRFTLHVFNCPVQLSFDPSIGACNWPSQGPACQGDTLLTN